ncbi:hypothetical protein [Amycolatopsis vancoresmycina]|uniref:Uncharacterized protein n=1 Tax=Amycolatopsis vancoresmycina DSM 44592 TaxID=1292037 RepID=R1FGE4_9PSEU|nr:hypothetical protein [Amycolatopsis vancoresmycina]EOD58688.1 hypothetical protein H480_42870 [Amycolatopsis vancoresmycina DSM 44592]
MATKEEVNASVGLVLAIIGAVCGTVATSLAAEPGPIRLLGLCLGAAIPPFVTAVGRWRPVRAGLAVLITVVAAVVTYSGAFGVGVATDHKIVPAPPGVPGPTAPWPPTTPPTTETSVHEDRELETTPEKLTCQPVCTGGITIKSVGKSPVPIKSVELTGPAKAKFTRTDDCVGKTLAPDATCSFQVTFEPGGASGPQTAQVIIRDDHGLEKTVELSGGGDLLDLSVSPTGLRCVVQPAGTVDGRDALQVFFHVSLTGDPADLPGLVPVKVTAGPGKTVTLHTAVGKTGSTVAALPLAATDYGQTRTVIVTVDPAREIAELSEANNALTTHVKLPAKPGHSTAVPC